MSKFNKDTAPVTPTAVNKMGEKAYVLDPKEEFVATILTTFLQPSYYEKEKETVARIKTAMSKVDPLFAAKAALYARDDANMRSVTHLIAGELPSRIVGQHWAKRFYRKIAVRPDDMAEIVAYYYNVIRGGKGHMTLPNSMKKGFREKLASMDPYLIDKYKMERKQFSLSALVKLLHPTPTQINAEAYKRLLEGKSLAGLYTSKILEKEMSKTGGKDKTVAQVNAAKEEAISSVIGNVKGMPIFNLIRNLRNIILYAPGQVDEACRQLVIEDKILKSRLLPFRFLSAYEEINKMTAPTTSTRSAVMFEDEIATRQVTAAELPVLKTKVMTALEKAMEISCSNIPKLEGRTAILIDHSGSMRGDDGGGSLVSAFSKTSSSMIANLFGVMVGMGQDNVYIGLFGDTLLGCTIDRKNGILKNAMDIHRLGAKVGGGTEQGVYEFFNECIKGRVHVDNVIIFSDCVIGNKNAWYGRGVVEGYKTGQGNFQEVFKDFRKVNPTCNVVSVDIRQVGGTSVFDKSLNVTQVAGWSTMIFDHIGAGTRGYKDLIAEIEAIEI